MASAGSEVPDRPVATTHHRDSLTKGLGAALAFVLLAGACSDATGEAACAQPTPLEQPPKIVDKLPLTESVQPISVALNKGYVNFKGFSRETVSELFQPLSRAVIDSGGSIIARENEGFEAEIFFHKKQGLAGIVSLRKGPCRGNVTVSVLYDPISTKRGRKILKGARNLPSSPTP